jgi:hypothetical protein
MRRAARLRSWEPTVTPIWASSPAAWTAVVTISVPLGRPLAARGGGGGGAAGRWAAVAFRCVAAAADLAAAFAFFGLAFAARGFAAAVRDAVALARRSPPRRVGRVERRLPSTLASAPAFEDFFDFFLADFCVMDTVIGRRGRRPL